MQISASLTVVKQQLLSGSANPESFISYKLKDSLKSIMERPLLTTKVKVNMTICGKTTEIMADSSSDSGIKITIKSDCKFVQHFAEELTEIGMMDLTKRIIENKVYMLASRSNITPTCLVPCGVVNSGWIETGLIAKNLALKEGAIKIIFME
jgi:hypothetical protein